MFWYVSKNISSFSKECNISFERALVFSLKKMFHLPKATTRTKIFLFKEKVEKRVAKISYGFTRHCFERDKLVCWKTCSITITMATEAHKQLFVSGFATTKWVIARLRTSFQQKLLSSTILPWNRNSQDFCRTQYFPFIYSSWIKKKRKRKAIAKTLGCLCDYGFVWE